MKIAVRPFVHSQYAAMQAEKRRRYRVSCAVTRPTLAYNGKRADAHNRVERAGRAEN